MTGNDSFAQKTLITVSYSMFGVGGLLQKLRERNLSGGRCLPSSRCLLRTSYLRTGTIFDWPLEHKYLSLQRPIMGMINGAVHRVTAGQNRALDVTQSSS
jgi:hypothetical protein